MPCIPFGLYCSASAKNVRSEKVGHVRNLDLVTPRKVKSHQSVAGCKMAHLLIPKMTGATPAVDKHLSGCPASLHIVINGNAIGRVGNLAMHIHGLNSRRNDNIRRAHPLS